MAKDYLKGEDYNLYIDTSSTWGGATWVKIKAVGDLSVDLAPGDIEVPERGLATGHLHGDGDAAFTFTLFEDSGDSNVDAIIDSIYDGTPVHLAIATAEGEPYWHMECCLVGGPMSANRGELTAWEVEAKRHGDSDNGFEFGASFDLDETN